MWNDKDPMRQGEASDLLPNAAEEAAEAAARARQEAEEIEQAALDRAAKKAREEAKLEDSDEFISPKDLDFLNGK